MKPRFERTLSDERVEMLRRAVLRGIPKPPESHVRLDAIPDETPHWIRDMMVDGMICGARIIMPPDADGATRYDYCLSPPIPGQDEINRQLPHRCAYHGGLGTESAPGRPSSAREIELDLDIGLALAVAGDTGKLASLSGVTAERALRSMVPPLMMRLARSMGRETEIEERIAAGESIDDLMVVVRQTTNIDSHEVDKVVKGKVVTLKDVKRTASKTMALPDMSNRVARDASTMHDVLKTLAKIEQMGMDQDRRSDLVESFRRKMSSYGFERMPDDIEGIDDEVDSSPSLGLASGGDDIIEEAM